MVADVPKEEGNGARHLVHETDKTHSQVYMYLCIRTNIQIKGGNNIKLKCFIYSVTKSKKGPLTEDSVQESQLTSLNYNTYTPPPFFHRKKSPSSESLNLTSKKTKENPRGKTSSSLEPKAHRPVTDRTGGRKRERTDDILGYGYHMSDTGPYW